jgi:SAM-dependent methyltransferase
MTFWYAPNPVPYAPHNATWHQPLHLHLSPMWAALSRVLPTLSGRVVDVGCGTRPYRPMFSSAVTEYVGVDREGTHPQPDVVADAHALPFEDEMFDAGVSFQVFEHVERPAECVRELARVVRVGGDVVITVPGVWPDHEVPHDYWRFTRYGLEAIVKNSGLEMVEITPLGGLWSALGQMACLELDRTWPGRLAIPLVNLTARSLDRRAHEKLVMNWLVLARRVR